MCPTVFYQVHSRHIFLHAPTIFPRTSHFQRYLDAPDIFFSIRPFFQVSHLSSAKLWAHSRFLFLDDHFHHHNHTFDARLWAHSEFLFTCAHFHKKSPNSHTAVRGFHYNLLQIHIAFSYISISMHAKYITTALP